MTTTRLLSVSARIVAFWAIIALAPTPADAVKRRAFVTSVSGTGNLGSWPEAGGHTGLAAGNAICRTLAAAADLPNANTYRAWLSTPTTDAACHVRALSGLKGSCTGGPPMAAGPWYLANGISNFTAGLDDLVGAPWEIYRPVLLTETLQSVPTAEGQREYWTGTSASGTGYSDWHCNSWTSSSAAVSAAMGDPLASAKFWSSAGLLSACSSPRRLLCVEPGTSEESRLHWSPGSLVFLTSASGTGNLSSWPEAAGASGVAAGDTICRTLAAAAHLPAPESFVAWLSSSSVDARDRLTSNGPYRRVDAYTVASSKADLIDGTTQNSIHVHEDGRYLADPPFGTATGTRWDGTAGADCANWTSNAGERTHGRPAHARLPDWTDRIDLDCNSPSRLYCFSNRVTIFWDGFELTGDTSRWSAAVP